MKNIDKAPRSKTIEAHTQKNRFKLFFIVSFKSPPTLSNTTPLNEENSAIYAPRTINNIPDSQKVAIFSNSDVLIFLRVQRLFLNSLFELNLYCI